MAAKQGLSAQLSQAGEDAKRAVLSRTTLSNSLWFSNLNTTCTIKSAPPRRPDVLGLLATKSGWLFKRNEQHVWQARYCCVVPHTFLYYFDAHPSNPAHTPSLTPKQQEELNQAIKQGYGKRGEAKQQNPRSSLYQVLGGVAGNMHHPQDKDPDKENELAPVDTTTSHSTLQPAGIIDLECYTTIHRNDQNQLLMELAGDPSVNPDLRSFYFCANNSHEGEEWNQALLANRHASLVDEKEAYKQVCDGFAQQLQVLHAELDQAQSLAESQQEELYRVRSQMEDSRRSCLRLVSDTLDRADDTVPAKRAYKTDLETIQAQDLGILPAVQLLSDYAHVLEETCRDSGSAVNDLEKQLATKQEGDTTRVRELEDEIKQLKADMKEQQGAMQSQLEMVTQKYIQGQKELQDVQKDLASQRMETTMYQSSTRTKLGELQSHKKILKKEVIELRKKLEEAHSQLDLFKHKESSVKMEAEQERQKAKLLERYVEKIESQVKVQQNMMEMMSSAGSQYGGGGSIYGDHPSFQHVDVCIPGSPAPPRTINKGYDSPSVHRGEYGNVMMNSASLGRPDLEDDDDDHDQGNQVVDPDGNPRKVYAMEAEQPKPRRTGSYRRNVDDDAKSHMSELTEDRTQRHFDAAFYFHQQQQKEYATQQRPSSTSSQVLQLRDAVAGGPPSIIIGGESENERGETSKLDTIMSTHTATRPRSEISSRYNETGPPKPQTPRRDRDSDSQSVSSVGSRSKLSVAQRSRMDAERQSTPVHIRVNSSRNSTPLRSTVSSSKKDQTMRVATGSLSLNNQNNAASSNNSTSGNSFFSVLGKKLERAIDSSIMGNGPSDDDSYQSTDIGTDVNTDVSTDVNGPAGLKPKPMGPVHEEEKKSGDTDSAVSAVRKTLFELDHLTFAEKAYHSSSVQTASLSLAERQAIQRQQQLKFLKEQGLINNEKEVRGGAGAPPPKVENDGGLSSSSSFGSFLRPTTRD